MKTLIDRIELWAEDVRLAKRLMKRESPEEYPELFKWALQLLYFEESRWIEICRIDNYPHGCQMGPHIHERGKTLARKAELTYEEAEEEILRIGSRILSERFGVRLR